MVYGREAVSQAEAQAQMLQGRKDLVDDSHVSVMRLISCQQFFVIGLFRLCLSI